MLAKLSSVPFREDDVETLAKLRQGGRWMSVDGGVVGLFEERTAAIGFDGQIRDLPPLAFGADAVVAARIGQDGLQVLGRVDDDLVAYNLSLDAGASWRVVGRFSGVDVVAAAYQGSARIVTARRDGVIEVADLTGTRLLSLPERLPNVVDVAAGGGGIVAHAEGGRISAWLTPGRQ